MINLLTVVMSDPPDPALDRREIYCGKASTFTKAMKQLGDQLTPIIPQINAATATADASAVAAQAVVNAAMFNGATAYALGQAAISGVNFLTYRRKAAGTSATDPSADPANWAPLGNPLGLRNRLMNATFEVNQRAVASPVTLAAGAYGHDRWKAGAAGCTYSWASANGLTTITITAGSLVQVIEGNNLDDGLANTYVLGWNGTATGKIGGGAFSGSGITGAANGGANLSIEFGVGTLAKPQLEPGAFRTTFDRRPYGMELDLCQRYYQRFGDSQINTLTSGSFYSATSWLGALQYSPMRAAPTLIVSAAADFSIEANSAGYGVTSILLMRPSKTSTRIDAVTTGATQGQGGHINIAANKFFALDAEL